MEVEDQPIDESLLLNLDGEGEETPEEEFTGEKDEMKMMKTTQSKSNGGNKYH